MTNTGVLVSLRYPTTGRLARACGYPDGMVPARLMVDVQDTVKAMLVAEAETVPFRVRVVRPHPIPTAIFVYTLSDTLHFLEKKFADAMVKIGEFVDKGGDPGDPWIDEELRKVDFALLKYDEKQYITRLEIETDAKNPMSSSGLHLEDLLLSKDEKPTPFYTAGALKPRNPQEIRRIKATATTSAGYDDYIDSLRTGLTKGTGTP